MKSRPYLPRNHARRALQPLEIIRHLVALAGFAFVLASLLGAVFVFWLVVVVSR